MDSKLQKLGPDIATLTKAKVLCIGDIMLDRFVYGNIDRISPEAPIPIFNIKSDKLMLGGAGNVACNLSGLGAKTHFISVIGSDQPGSSIKQLFSELPKIKTNLITESKRRTAVKTRYVASGQQMMRTDDETIAPIQEKTKQRLIKYIRSALDKNTVVILSDYSKGVLTNDVIKKIIKLAKNAKVQIVIDPQGPNYECYRGADIVTPNLRELSLATGMKIDNDKEIIAASRKLISKHGIKSILATRSSDGMSLIDSRNFKTFTAASQEVYDVSGAGDTVAAALGAGLGAGISLEKSIMIANASAGIVVAKTGTAVAYAHEIMHALHATTAPNLDQKLYDFPSAVEQIKIWRSQKKIIGLTSGCFDLLHSGHLSTIETAKSECDKLIIGLNGDSSIKQIKGSQRPIQSETTRAKLLTSLECVDAVVIFYEDTPINLIQSLKPDVFVKGADYRIEKMPEAQAVNNYGGKIILAKIKRGHSTTATISKMKG